jgi:exosortase K
LVLAALAALIIWRLKRYYADARVDDLRWILAPTTRGVAALTGARFEWDAGQGYFSRERLFVIAKVCAGINFLIAAFGMTAWMLARRVVSAASLAAVLTVSLLIAYSAAVVVNAARISFALWLTAHTGRPRVDDGGAGASRGGDSLLLRRTPPSLRLPDAIRETFGGGSARLVLRDHHRDSSAQRCGRERPFIRRARDLRADSAAPVHCARRIVYAVNSRMHLSKTPAVLCVALAAVSCRTAQVGNAAAAPATQPPPIVQPGAPGQPSRVITAEAAADVSKVDYIDADIKFMQGMIGHHAQAIEMVAFIPTHSSRREMVLLGQRIDISQTDEIKMMQDWLSARGQQCRA